MSPRKPKTATQRRRRTRSLRKHHIRELPTPVRLHPLVEALEAYDAHLGIQPSGKYLRRRNVTAKIARIIREWTAIWLCRTGTDKP
jgi:hypothetical protein